MADVDIRTLEDASTSWEQTGKDLGSGAAGGIAQVLLGESYYKDFWSIGGVSAIAPSASLRYQLELGQALIRQVHVLTQLLDRSTIR